MKVLIFALPTLVRTRSGYESRIKILSAKHGTPGEICNGVTIKAERKVALDVCRQGNACFITALRGKFCIPELTGFKL